MISNEVRIRIGRSIRNIPNDYHHFFTRPAPEIIDFSGFAPRLFRLTINLRNSLKSEIPPLLDCIEIDGRERFRRFLGRVRWVVLWGHYFWRLSDLSRLRLEPISLIQTEGELEAVVNWRLNASLDEGVKFISGPLTWKSAWEVQSVRIKRMLSEHYGTDTSSATKNIVLFSGINRYIFDPQTGFISHLIIDRIEPKLDRSQWKWRSLWFQRLTSTERVTQPAMINKS